MVDIMRGRIKVGTDRAGRNLQDVGVVLGAVTVVDQNRRKALEIARRRAAPYIAVIGDKDPTVMADFPEEIAAIKKAMSRGDLEGAIRVLPDGLLKRLAFAGDPGDIIKQTGTIFAQGAKRVDFGSPHGINSMEGIDLLGKEVLPYFRK
jgi:5,10-methylenetetrahydromethanopterin reductase